MSTKEKTKEAMIRGINRFLFYAWNYDTTVYETQQNGEMCRFFVPRVMIEAKWNCNVDHIVDKWCKAVQSGNPDAYFPRFYAELSADNRRAFLEWIIKNYTDELYI